MKPVRLIEADDEPRFGGKAASLARALQAGLPVPPGFALGHEDVATILDPHPEALADLQSAWSKMRSPLAARSSAVGEDSTEASFAGQHVSILNVASFPQLKEAIAEVAASVHSSSARAYREKLGIGAPPRWEWSCRS